MTHKERVEKIEYRVSRLETKKIEGLYIDTADARFLLNRIAKLEEAPEEKKPPKPLSFDDWIRAGELFFPTCEDAWNASRRNTKKDMSRLLMRSGFHAAASWLEKYYWGTSDE